MDPIPSITETPDVLHFKTLPYSFTRRLSQLMPLHDLATFSYISAEAYKLASLRCYISSEVWITTDLKLLQKLKLRKPGEHVLLSADFLASRKSCFAIRSLALHFDTIDDYNNAMPFVSGNYSALRMNGTYHWTQINKFMNPQVTTLILNGKILYDGEQDLRKFVETLAKYSKNQFFAEVNSPNLPQNFFPLLRSSVWVSGQLSSHIVTLNENVTYIRVMKTKIML